MSCDLHQTYFRFRVVHFAPGEVVLLSGRDRFAMVRSRGRPAGHVSAASAVRQTLGRWLICRHADRELTDGGEIVDGEEEELANGGEVVEDAGGIPKDGGGVAGCENALTARRGDADEFGDEAVAAALARENTLPQLRTATPRLFSGKL